MPASRIIPAKVAAVDLLSTLLSFCNKLGVDNDKIHVDEQSMKLCYLLKYEEEQSHHQLDPELEEILKDDTTEEVKSPVQVFVVSAEILRVAEQS